MERADPAVRRPPRIALATPERLGRKPLKLSRPPAEPEADPRRWAATLVELGYFDRMTDAARNRTIDAFVDDAAQMAADPQRMYRDYFAPMRRLLVAETGRIAWVEASDDLVADPARVEQDVRRQLTARGVALPPMTQGHRDGEWRVSFGDAGVRIAKLKAGKPSGLGMQHPPNVTAAIVRAIATSMTRRLAADGAAERVATIDDCSAGADASRASVRHGLIVLDDALSYELMWTPLGGCYCRVVRADVF